MVKDLSDMSLKELWQLFPIFLVEHKEEWEDWYEEEKERLLHLLPSQSIKSISHIGSTAVPNIWAKNIVDILLEVPEKEDLQDFKKRLLDAGYLLMSEGEKRLSFNKGYTKDGLGGKVFYVDLRYQGDNGGLYFRDYLREYPEVAKDYERLKLGLWEKYEHNRDAYTDAKSDFIRKYTQKAKKNDKGKDNVRCFELLSANGQ
ncbi:GrpB family protein [Streptococcus mutans]|nr:GrpB family protein [Streptococcus mutans]